MPDVAPEYTAALARALLAVRPVASAIDDITNRVLRDRPGDIVGYLETCKASLPSYFQHEADAKPAEPTPGDPAYNDWFIKNLAKIAGGPTAAPEAATKAQPPTQISRSSPDFDKQFVTHLDAIASGQCAIVP